MSLMLAVILVFVKSRRRWACAVLDASTKEEDAPQPQVASILQSQTFCVSAVIVE